MPYLKTDRENVILIGLALLVAALIVIVGLLVRADNSGDESGGEPVAQTSPPTEPAADTHQSEQPAPVEDAERTTGAAEDEISTATIRAEDSVDEVPDTNKKEAPESTQRPREDEALINDQQDSKDDPDIQPGSGDETAEVYSVFDGNQFKQLFNEADLENLATPSQPPTITGDPETDRRIQQVALNRGYRLRPMPEDVSRLVLVEGDRHLLQPEAAQAYLDLKAAAAADGLTIWLVSAYRDYDRQRNIFLGKATAPYNDEEVFEILKRVSVPGYSKHHTGYTIDIAEGKHLFDDFVGTKSHQWISADNYLNAKKYGWIPSYPPDGGKQGPDPEAWEFVYVGRKYLTSSSGTP